MSDDGHKFLEVQKLITDCCTLRSRQFGSLTAAELLDYVGNKYGRPYVPYTPNLGLSDEYKAHLARQRARHTHETSSGTMRCVLGTVIVGEQERNGDSAYWSTVEHKKQRNKNRSQGRPPVLTGAEDLISQFRAGKITAEEFMRQTIGESEATPTQQQEDNNHEDNDSDISEE